MGWEAKRIGQARRILDSYIAGLDAAETAAVRGEAGESRRPPRLIADVVRTESRFALTFAGQANAFIDELAKLYRECFAAAQIIDQVAERITLELDGMQACDRAVYSRGFDVLEWLQTPQTRPSAEYIQMAAVSEALVLLTQLAHYVRLLSSGYDCPEFWEHIGVAAGHSQGIMAAIFAAENAGKTDIAERVGDYVIYMVYQGLRMQQAYPLVGISPSLVAQAREADAGDISPMAMVAGLTAAELVDAIEGLSLDVTVSLENTRLRKVVSGRPEELDLLRRAIFDDYDARAKKRSQGRHAGSLVPRQWQYLPVSGPFHSEYMRSGAVAIRSDIARLDFVIDAKALQFAVLDTATGEDLRNADDLTDRIVEMQFLERVRWDICVLEIVRADARFVLDFGPGESNCRMTADNLRGRGVLTLCVATEDGRAIALDEQTAPEPPADYRIFAPRLVTTPDGVTRIDNRFTRFTGRSPVILPGMTPTTVEADIVAAAANSGYVAELAGGGQVTAEMLKQRLAELSGKLISGNGVVFNALYLDPYLWKLHFGGNKLVLRLREEGYPLIGVTVSAGIPPLEEAVALLRELVGGGLWLNAFKPGTDNQITQVLEIADAVPDITLCMHIEGGKAGGHHSWEDLQELVIRHYDRIRQRPNVMLAVGGGIASEEQATAYLDGSWSVSREMPRMPVDAVFLGTVAMAVKEAKTSRAVKEALVRASGTPEWILDGQVSGEIMSGRSELGASIHYMDNAAARADRLLEEVAGNPEAIKARRDEIIESLGKTAKPYFGDMPDMTYAVFFERMVELMAIGCGGEYEYGRWLDVSHAARVIEMVRTAEARLCSRNDAEFASIAQTDASLREPEAFFEQFNAAYPAAAVERVHQDDADYFVEVCRWPGKPVNFVPVLDESVRKWYKSDSLWQVHRGNYDADQVLVIPGPEAVAGIKEIDEPVAGLLGRFEASMVTSLRQEGVPARRLSTSADRRLGDGGATCEGGAITCDASEALESDRWLERVASLGTGPLAASLMHRDVTVAASAAAGVRLAKNPLRRLMAAREGWTAEYRNERGVLRALMMREQSGIVVARMHLGETVDDVTELEAALVVVNAHDSETPGDELPICATWIENQGAGFVAWDRDRYLARQVPFFSRLMLGRPAPAVQAFADATTTVRVTRDALALYALATGDDSRNVMETAIANAPGTMVFALAWESVFAALTGMRADFLNLLHEQNEAILEAGWPVRDGDMLTACGRVVGVTGQPGGRRVVVTAELLRGSALVARLRSSFFIRADEIETGHEIRESYRSSFDVADKAACDFLTAQPWFQPTAELRPGTTVTLDCPSFLDACRDGHYTFSAAGEITFDGERAGSVLMTPGMTPPGSKRHPVVEASRLLGAGVDDAVPTTAPRDLGRKVLQAPTDMHLYARASGDFNPLHTADHLARFAGFSAPIVHGMWTAATTVHRVIRLAAAGDANRVTQLRTRFVSPVRLGEDLVVSARHVGMRRGERIVEIEASAARGAEFVPVLDGEVSIRAPRTAYGFPGQGVQSQGMGMIGYARSPAAKAVWDSAEEICRDQLGFSLLHVVRENPRELLVQGSAVRHPDGVLFLTQFTQVALAVAAIAQVRQLKEHGVFVEDAIFCGHSLGEYSALAAIPEVLSLADVVVVVYNRGRTMDALVARDDEGASPFGMGVIRPHYANLAEGDAHALVTQVANETQLPLEIVNFNVRGRQYAVTGDVRALRHLNVILAERRAAAGGTKPAYLDVPGIDVPFHSTLLLGGVPEFRETLESCLRSVIDPQLLVGRYIPNLVGRPFSLEREFVELVHTASRSPVLSQVLADWQAWRQDARADSLTRTLLVELLAYQFASPVRWIETQDLLFDGPSSVDELIEIGHADQPVISAMAQATLAQKTHRANEIRVLNSESHFEELFGPTNQNIEIDALPALPEPVTPAAPGVVEVASPPAHSGALAAEISTGDPIGADPAIDANSVPDAPPSPTECLRILLALQTKLQPAQISEGETLDELLGGNSARRNQVLVDIGAEFGISAIDGAHDLPFGDLADRVCARATTYAPPGRYLETSVDQCVAARLSSAGIQKADVLSYLSREWAIGPGRALSVLLRLPLYVREGASRRGGALSDLQPVGIADSRAAEAWIDSAVGAYGREVGLTFNKRAVAGAGPDTQVDAAALGALSDRLFGREGVLTKTAELWQTQTDADVYAGRVVVGSPATAGDSARLAAYEREHSAEYEAAIAAHFDEDKHLAFTSSWAWVRRDVYALAQRLALGEVVDGCETATLSSRLDAGARQAARALANVARREGRELHADVLDELAREPQGGVAYVPRFTPTAPRQERQADGHWLATSAARPGECDPRTFTRAVCMGDSPIALVGHETAAEPLPFQQLLLDACASGLTFAGRTALVTGAGPGSIALEMVKSLLEGGARVVVTTSSYGLDRSKFLKRVYQEHAAPGAELHVIPANQGSFTDIDALVHWMVSSRYESVGAVQTQLKPAFVPDIVVPFGALGETAFLTGQDAKSQAVLRVLLLGVERLLARLADVYRDNAICDRRLHIVLPLSPNHGVFGGDGLYGESKAALEVLLNKWRAEQADWGRFTSLVGARIGWVRGTGLMGANDVLAARMESDTGMRTFAPEEMGFLLTALCSDKIRDAALSEPLIAELTGGFDTAADISERARTIREDIAESTTFARRRQELDRAFVAALDIAPTETVMVRPRINHRVTVPIPSPMELGSMPELDHLNSDRVVVVVGFGEVSPLGSARTRWSVERTGTLSIEGVAELAWMMGLIQPSTSGIGWQDTDSGESVDDLDLKDRYEDVVMSHTGIRFTDVGVANFDPDAVHGLVEVHLEQDLSFTVPTRAQAEELRKADSENTVVLANNGAFTVIRKRGAKVRVPRSLKLLRAVAGQVPSGWDATRYGIPAEFVDQVDRSTLFNLVATVEAFMQAGLTPDEIYAFIHPSRVGTTQGSGLGGMTKLQKLYRDWYDGSPRQTDVLQETLINVIAGYVVQSYTGSYGPMSIPVGACATAGVSVQSAVNLIQQREADFVITGGVDDFNVEGVIGFSDMSATCATDTMERLGLRPCSASRPNDRRRRGFVESQGAGAILLCRASLAVEAGLPVYGVVAYAGSFADGINQSVPAPGIGALSCAAELVAAERNAHDACDLVGRRTVIRELDEKADALADLVGVTTAEQIRAAAVQKYAHDFYHESTNISPLRGALAVFGVGPDDIVVASKHDTGTQANDLNENRLHHMLQAHLGRTPGLPLAVISQKSLTGHPKGAAAAWQLNGLMQAMADGVIPGNQNLDDVDPMMADFATMMFSDREITVGSGRLRAGIVTSLGFGHVGALVALVHPFYFWRMLNDVDREGYAQRLSQRTDLASRTLTSVLSGRERLVAVRSERPFAGKPGSAEHLRHEARMLLDPSPPLSRSRPASRFGES
ncbi:fatty acid synthase subunit beta domain-containing protein [Mycobacterium sp. Dal123C01]|uniref:fatty acid synthase subunit beta domain-containing protein n=1 Tax=Mycobacterium sp. Dal123C01 TaxID=3457577 RepID=UPI00403EEE2B